MAHRPLVVLVSVRILTSVRRGPTHHSGDSRGPTTEVAERFRRSWLPIISWSGMAHVEHPLTSDTDGGEPQFSAACRPLGGGRAAPARPPSAPARRGRGAAGTAPGTEPPARPSRCPA